MYRELERVPTMQPDNNQNKSSRIDHFRLIKYSEARKWDNLLRTEIEHQNLNKDVFNKHELAGLAISVHNIYASNVLEFLLLERLSYFL